MTYSCPCVGFTDPWKAPDSQFGIHLVAQCSAIGVSVAATPPSRSIFGRNFSRNTSSSTPPPSNLTSVLLSPELSKHSCDRGVGKQVRHGLLGGVAWHSCGISKPAGICRDTLCGTLCSATGVTAHVCRTKLPSPQHSMADWKEGSSFRSTDQKHAVPAGRLHGILLEGRPIFIQSRRWDPLSFQENFQVSLRTIGAAVDTSSLWYPPLRFGSQRRIPNPQFFLGFQGIHHWFCFFLCAVTNVP